MSVRPHAAPHRLEPSDTLDRRVAGKVRGVDRTDRGTDNQIGGPAARDKRLEHADLDRPETAAAREHKCRAQIVFHAGLSLALELRMSRRTQSAGTVRPVAHSRSAATRSAMTTDSGRVARISASTWRADGCWPAAFAT